MDKYQAVQAFWSGFGWEAFNEATVPDNAFATRNGYITYGLSSAEFDSAVAMTASIWQRSPSWAGVLEMAELIRIALSNGGTLLPYDGGVVWVKMGVPFAQTMSDEDDSVRRVVLMTEVEFI